MSTRRGPAASGEPPVAILAGSGELPRLLAESLAHDGRPCRVLALRGFADRSTAARADAVVGLLDVGRTLACLASWRPAMVALAGGLQRPSPSAAIDAFSAFRNRGELKAILARGDDGLLRGVIDLLEEQGHRLVGVHDLAPELLARPGPYGTMRPAEPAEAEIALGLRLLADLSAYDIGQAVVVEGERILAVEGLEGTDRMLARATGRRRFWLRAKRPPAGVLVKAPKRGQDLRVDLPAIGPRTVRRAAKAGLAGIAVATGYTLVLNARETAQEADRLGLFVTGVSFGPEPGS